MIIANSKYITIIASGGFNTPGAIYTLVLVSKLTKKEYRYSLTSASNSPLYYRFVNQFELPDDEYEYTLVSDTVVDRGLIRVGDYKLDTNTNKEYIVYEG